MKKLLGIFILILSLNGFTQSNNYKIKFELNGFNDSVFYLVSYYADKFQVLDTSDFSSANVIFEGDSLLQGGIYMLAGEKMNKHFEFLIDKEQQFKVIASKNNLIPSLKSEGSISNKHFFDYLRFNKTAYEKINEQKQNLSKSENITQTNAIKKNIEELNKGIDNYKKSYVQKNPSALLSKIFLGMEEPEVDPSLSKLQSYHFYKNNYWNNIDLTDARMIRTPILHNKLSNFFNKIILQNPDTLIKEIDGLLQKPMAQEIKNHFILNLALKYEYPYIMGLDKVFVHLVDKYFKTNEITGISKGVMETIEKRATKISRLLIGEPAPDLVMMDTMNKPQSLYNLEADFILVMFWDQECQVCQKEIKLLNELLAENLFDLEVFAVGTDPKLEDWKQHIVDNSLQMNHVTGTQSFTDDYHELYDIYSTPTIYLLNHNKQIIAKRLAVEQISDFLKDYQNKHKEE